MMDGSLKEDMKTPATLRIQRRGHAPRRRHGARGRRLGRRRARLPRFARNRHGRRGRRRPAPKACSIIRQLLTDPEQAADFVAQTGVDALAVAIGTSHGAYKFTRPPTGDILDIDRIKAIHARIPNTHLVMHGSSSVPQEWLADDPRARRRRSRKPTACRSRRSSKASGTACARSTSTPTSASR